MEQEVTSLDRTAVVDQARSRDPAYTLFHGIANGYSISSFSIRQGVELFRL